MTQKIAAIVEVESRLRRAKTVEEAHILAVNLFRTLISYEMAVSFEFRGSFKVIAHSDLPSLSTKSSFLTSIARTLKKKIPLESSVVVDASEISTEFEPQGIEFVLLVPIFAHGSQELMGMIVIGSSRGFSKESTIIAQHCSETLSLVLSVLARGKRLSFSHALSKGVKYLVSVLLLCGVMMIPVNVSTQGKAQIVATDPVIVTAPLNGVIKKVVVKGNEYVKENATLLYFDDVEARGKQKIAAHTVNISASEIVKQERALFFDSSIKNKLEESRAETAVKSMEYNAISSQLRKLTVYAPKSGVVALDSPIDLVGRPVKTGEKLMSIVNPQKVEVEILVSAYESNVIKIGDKVNIYLDNNPMYPLVGEVYKVYYEPVVAASNVLSYKAYARLPKGENVPSIGMCGNIKIQGEKVTLFWYIFRRPVAYMRWYFG